MANIFIAFAGLEGGAGTDTVQGTVSTSLVNNAITIAFHSNKKYTYLYNSTSITAHDGVNFTVIQPYDLPASGRHILQSAYEHNIDHDLLTNFLATEHKTAEVIRAEVATPLYVETRTSDPGTPVTGQIWLRTDL
jgi:hypothetical protein